MAEQTFNLLDEPWIRVVYPNCREAELSLKQVFAEAHRCSELAGELPTQNMAVLRLLLAVLHTVFYRWDENGDEAKITDEDDALDRWQNIWEMEQFPTEVIDTYLENWRARFDLLDQKRPFYQVPEAKIGTEYASTKLNGEISESSNKKRLFPVRTGENKEVLSYAEAARWLLYVNGFDDTSAKPKVKGLPSVGAGWLGKLGLIQAEGKNLFETLMLNLVLLNENDEPWASPCPAWELDEPRTSERTGITCPDNQAALLTLQSRRLLLRHDKKNVIGFYLLGGDFFNKEDAFVEQMTVWRKVSDKKSREIHLQPARHNHDRKMWQDFSAIIAESNEKSHIPGVVRWLNQLISNDCLPTDTIGTYRISSVQYGDKDFFVKDVFEDSLSFHLNLLSELNGKWIERIKKEVEKIESLARTVGILANELDQAAGGDGKNAENCAREQFFYRIDIPFRSWLCTLSAGQTDIEREAKVVEWRETAKDIAEELGREMVRSAGSTAYAGKSITVDKNRDTKIYYCAPDAFRKFKYRLKEYHSGKE